MTGATAVDSFSCRYSENEFKFIWCLSLMEEVDADIPLAVGALTEF